MLTSLFSIPIASYYSIKRLVHIYLPYAILGHLIKRISISTCIAGKVNTNSIDNHSHLNYHIESYFIIQLMNSVLA